MGVKKNTPQNATKPKTVVDCECVVCQAIVKSGQDALECTMCQKWCHRYCPTTKQTNIRDAIYDAHCDQEEDQPWFCPVCKPLLPTVLAAFKDLTAFKIEMEDKMAVFQAQIDELKKAAAPPAAVHAPVHPSSPINLQDEIHEVLEKERKKLNLVVVGLPETDKKATRSDADKEFVMGVGDAAGVRREDIVDIFRNGLAKEEKTPGGLDYARITKVKFVSLSSKLTFMKKFKGAKPDDDAYSGTYVRPDLTFRERQVDKALRDKLFAQRELDPDADLIIRRGSIVPRGTPTITPTPTITIQ